MISHLQRLRFVDVRIYSNLLGGIRRQELSAGRTGTGNHTPFVVYPVFCLCGVPLLSCLPSLSLCTVWCLYARACMCVWCQREPCLYQRRRLWVNIFFLVKRGHAAVHHPFPVCRMEVFFLVSASATQDLPRETDVRSKCGLLSPR